MSFLPPEWDVKRVCIRCNVVYTERTNLGSLACFQHPSMVVRGTDQGKFYKEGGWDCCNHAPTIRGGRERFQLEFRKGCVPADHTHTLAPYTENDTVIIPEYVALEISIYSLTAFFDFDKKRVLIRRYDLQETNIRISSGLSEYSNQEKVELNYSNSKRRQQRFAAGDREPTRINHIIHQPLVNSAEDAISIAARRDLEQRRETALKEDSNATFRNRYGTNIQKRLTQRTNQKRLAETVNQNNLIRVGLNNPIAMLKNDLLRRNADALASTLAHAANQPQALANPPLNIPAINPILAQPALLPQNFPPINNPNPLLLPPNNGVGVGAGAAVVIAGNIPILQGQALQGLLGVGQNIV
jgi:hypothetical protein